MAVEFVKCPTCGDDVSTCYRPVSCYKCGPIDVDPELLKEDAAESISSFSLILLPASFVLVFIYQLLTNNRGGLETTVAFTIGKMIFYVPLMLIGYFIARALTKRHGRWEIAYIVILVAYWIIAPRLERYGSGGSFF